MNLLLFCAHIASRGTVCLWSKLSFQGFCVTDSLVGYTWCPSPVPKVDLFTAQYNKITSPSGGKVKKFNCLLERFQFPKFTVFSQGTNELHVCTASTGPCCVTYHGTWDINMISTCYADFTCYSGSNIIFASDLRAYLLLGFMKLQQANWLACKKGKISELSHFLILLSSQFFFYI